MFSLLARGYPAKRGCARRKLCRPSVGDQCPKYQRSIISLLCRRESLDEAEIDLVRKQSQGFAVAVELSAMCDFAQIQIESRVLLYASMRRQVM